MIDVIEEILFISANIYEGTCLSIIDINNKQYLFECNMFKTNRVDGWVYSVQRLLFLNICLEIIVSHTWSKL